MNSCDFREWKLSGTESIGTCGASVKRITVGAVMVISLSF